MSVFPHKMNMHGTFFEGHFATVKEEAYSSFENEKLFYTHTHTHTQCGFIQHYLSKMHFHILGAPCACSGKQNAYCPWFVRQRSLCLMSIIVCHQCHVQCASLLSKPDGFCTWLVNYAIFALTHQRNAWHIINSRQQQFKDGWVFRLQANNKPTWQCQRLQDLKMK